MKTKQEKYFTERKPLDIMVGIKSKTGQCPIKAISGDEMLYCIKKPIKLEMWTCGNADNCKYLELHYGNNCHKCPYSEKEESIQYVDDCKSCIDTWLKMEVTM